MVSPQLPATGSTVQAKKSLEERIRVNGGAAMNSPRLPGENFVFARYFMA